MPTCKWKVQGGGEGKSKDSGTGRCAGEKRGFRPKRDDGLARTKPRRGRARAKASECILFFYFTEFQDADFAHFRSRSLVSSPPSPPPPLFLFLSAS